MKRAVLLGAVSDAHHAQDPESQLGPLRATAGRLGYEIAKEVSLKMSRWDLESAAEVHRIVYAALDETQADVLMVWAWDRFSREGIEGAFREIRHLEKDRGVHFYSYQEPFLNTGSDPQQRELLLSLAAWHAKWESQRKSERVKAKAASKRREAEKLGQRARWGLGHIPTPADEVEIHRLRNQEPKKTMREIAKLTGFSVGTVYRVLSPARSNRPGAAGSDSASKKRGV